MRLFGEAMGLMWSDARFEKVVVWFDREAQIDG